MYKIEVKNHLFSYNYNRIMIYGKAARDQEEESWEHPCIIIITSKKTENMKAAAMSREKEAVDLIISELIWAQNARKERSKK